MLDPNESQTLVNFLLGIVMSIGGWFLKDLRDENKELRKDIAIQQSKLADHRQEIADQYLKKNDFHNYMDLIREQLDRIERAVSQKADKAS